MLKLQYYQIPQNLQKASRSSLIFLAILFLIFCKDISGYLSDYDSSTWYYYFTLVERLSMTLVLISTINYIKAYCWVGAELLLCFLIQDLIDRVFFNIKEVGINDYVTIGLVITIAIVKLTIKTTNLKHLQQTK
jgi:hypothetical protein